MRLFENRPLLIPGPVSDSHKGPPEDGPYVPSWCYDDGPRACRHCGCHEGFHGDDGRCKRASTCGCPGIHPDDVTPFGTR